MFYFYSFARLEKAFTPEVLKNLYDAGARFFMWGYEAESERIMKLINKGIDLSYRKKILDIWCNIPEGITETYVHPALETDELKEIVPLWEQRVWEYQVMKDPETEKYLNAHGVELVSYRDIIKMKSK